ncbi:hypothetical protein D3C81_2281490 [compost metagenome]
MVSAQGKVSYDIQQLVAGWFVREVQVQIIQDAFLFGLYIIFIKCFFQFGQCVF